MAGSQCGRGEIFRRRASRGVGEQRLILVAGATSAAEALRAIEVRQPAPVLLDRRPDRRDQAVQRPGGLRPFRPPGGAGRRLKLNEWPAARGTARTSPMSSRTCVSSSARSAAFCARSLGVPGCNRFSRRWPRPAGDCARPDHGALWLLEDGVPARGGTPWRARGGAMIGCEGRFDYGALGPATNLAARLCSHASPGQTLIGQRVFAATEEAVETTPVGSLELKGFGRPVVAYEVRGLRQPPT